MAFFDHEIIEQVVAACQTGLESAAQSLSRTFGQSVELAAPASSSLDLAQLAEECRGAGLILCVRVSDQWALFLLPQSSGFVPDWCLQPDADATRQLATLAIELGASVLPEPFTPSDGRAGFVRDLSTALHRAGLSAQAARVALQIRGGEKTGFVSLIWPASQADAALLETAAPQTEHAATAVAQRNPPPGSPMPPAVPQETGAPSVGPRKRQIEYKELEDGITQLPSYSRSLLKIKVPVMVTLAESKQPVENVLAIGPGSIIHFNKPCEDSLALEIDGQKVALGEAVKVGDKFGLWITSMILPEERFWVLSDQPHVERAK